MENEMSWNDKLNYYLKEEFKGSLKGFLEAIEKQTGVRIASRTLRDYINGRSKRITIKNYADALYRITNIEEIKEAYSEKGTKLIKHKIKDKYIEKEGSELRQLIINTRSLTELVSARYLEEGSYEPSIEKRAEIFSNLVNTTIQNAANLVQYYRENPNEIDRLTSLVERKIRKEDAGYLISILNAIFDKDKFKSWVLMANYKPRGRK